MSSSQASETNAVVKATVLSGFVDGKDNLDNYLLRFKRYALVVS